ncbi:MAG: PaaI family thioesterase [Defluviicoccus sp.]|nr:PaaI family thioesterase [Defluviicoccus sp.]MDG4593302.1 PaaI family thioesterase [Defluviicoccus sp.]
MKKAIQDYYPENFSHCYGCGKNNPDGHHLKSYLDGEDVVARFTPAARYTGGVPNHVYGGMVASLLDCHGAASAAGFTYRAQNRELGEDGAPIRFVTASLKVDYLRPTPIGVELLLTGKLRSLEGRKVWVDLSLAADGVTCAKGEMLAILVRE